MSSVVSNGLSPNGIAGASDVIVDKNGNALGKGIDMVPMVPELRSAVMNIGSIRPQQTRAFYNLATQYYIDWCVQKILGRFKFTGLPEYWPYDYFAELLLMEGHLCVADVAEYGVVFFQNSFEGRDLFYQPVRALIANEEIGTREFTIGVNCEIVKLKPDFSGFATLVMKYAYLLAQCDASVDVNLWNSKVTAVYKAKDDKQAKEMKLVNQKISEGEPAVYTAGISESDIFYMPAKQNYIAGDIIDTKRSIINEFLSELSINNSPIDKKERVNTKEVESNNQQLGVTVAGYLRRMEECFDKVNKMFGLNLGVELDEVDITMPGVQEGSDGESESKEGGSSGKSE